MLHIRILTYFVFVRAAWKRGTVWVIWSIIQHEQVLHAGQAPMSHMICREDCTICGFYLVTRTQHHDLTLTGETPNTDDHGGLWKPSSQSWSWLIDYLCRKNDSNELQAMLLRFAYQKSKTFHLDHTCFFCLDHLKPWLLWHASTLFQADHVSPPMSHLLWEATVLCRGNCLKVISSVSLLYLQIDKLHILDNKIPPEALFSVPHHHLGKQTIINLILHFN
jgi:hypothetical protein